MYLGTPYSFNKIGLSLIKKKKLIIYEKIYSGFLL